MASAAIMERFKNQKVSSKPKANRIRQGKGVLVLEYLRWDKSEKSGADLLKAGFYVKSSESYPGALTNEGQPETANPSGSRPNYAIEFTSDPKKKHFVERDFIELIEALVGVKITDGNVLIAAAEELTNDDPSKTDDEGQLIGVQPGRGFEVQYWTEQAGPIKTGEHKDKMFTKPNFRHVAISDEQKAANIALMDGGGNKAA